jgi:hypothetical protein
MSEQQKNYLPSWWDSFDANTTNASLLLVMQFEFSCD